MRNHLLQLLFVAILLAHSAVGYGQSSAYGKLLKSIPEPVYLLNSTTIVNGLFTSLNPKSFTSIIVYKNQEVPDPLKNLSSTGIVDISCNQAILGNSFTEIASQHGLHGPVTFIINGNKLNAMQLAVLRIAPEAIGQLSVTQPTSQNSDTIVNIQLAVSKKTEQNDARSANKSRVMIR